MELPAGKIDCGIAYEFAELVQHRPRFHLMAVDIPIGLPDSGPRDCDRAARQFLGELRGRSVFRAPIRPALGARTREEADRITRSLDGTGVSAQAFGIVPKIEEVDALVSVRPLLQRRIREVHPEVSFALMNGGTPLADSKKTRTGVRARARLIENWLGLAPTLSGASEVWMGDGRSARCLRSLKDCVTYSKRYRAPIPAAPTVRPLRAPNGDRRVRR